MESTHKKEERISHEIGYGQTAEPYISEIESLLETVEETGISKRALALLLLQGDRTAPDVISNPEETHRDKSEKGQSEKGQSEKSESGRNDFEKFQRLAETTSEKAGIPLPYLFTLKRQELVNEIVEQIMKIQEKEIKEQKTGQKTKTEKREKARKKSPNGKEHRQRTNSPFA